MLWGQLSPHVVGNKIHLIVLDQNEGPVCGKAQNYIFYAHGVKLVIPPYKETVFTHNNIT